MKLLKTVMLVASLALSPVAASAAAPAAAVSAAPAAAAVDKDAPAAPERAAPMAGIGQPVDGLIGIQPQVTDNGQYGRWMHDALLMPIITLTSLLVLGLLLWIVVRYRRAANPVPSTTSHNTVLEVIWTLLPVLILVGISLPSISLLAAQYKPADKNAVTIKAIGHQWNWSYLYPDHLGDTEILAQLLPEADAAKSGEPYLLATDNRIVIPVDTEIKMIVTSDDVIHSWAVPAFWVKMDAVPGRLNEVTFKVQKGKEGVYYGQCSELCGARHGYMPIAVEVVSKEKFAQWVASQGGTMPGAAKAEAAVAPAAAKPAAAPAAPKPVPAAPAPASAAANATN